MPTEKKLTAMQGVIDLLEILKKQQLAIAKSAKDNNEPTAGCDGMYVAYSIAIKVATDKLTTDRQQLIDAVKYGGNYYDGNELIGETYYNNTFKTQ